MEKFLKNLLKKIKLSEPTISTVLGGLVILVVGILIFNYFKTEQEEQPSQETPFEEIELETVEKELMPEGLPQVYKVEENDSLWKISEKFYQSGYNWVDIARENNLIYPDYLEVGQKLNLPQAAIRKPEKEVIGTEAIVVEEKQGISGEKYTVKEGDYLWQIAIRAYGDGYKWPEIAQLNNLVYPDYLEVGQELKLPR